MTEANWGTLITVIGGCILAYMQHQSKRHAEAAALAAEQVRLDLIKQNSVSNTKADASNTKLDTSNTKLDDLAEVTSATHTLVNSNMGMQLQINAELARWKADRTKDAKDIEAAERAERKLEEHNSKQDEVDAAKDQIKTTKDERTEEQKP